MMNQKALAEARKQLVDKHELFTKLFRIELAKCIEAEVDDQAFYAIAYEMFEEHQLQMQEVKNGVIDEIMS